MFHKCFNSFEKEVSKLFKGNFQGCVKHVSEVLYESFNGVSRKDLVVSNKFKGVSMVIQKRCIGLSSGVQRKFQGCSGKLLAALLLHASHHSFPSRRRACFLIFCS